MEWISINTRLPDHGINVLVIDDNGFMITGNYFKDSNRPYWSLNHHCSEYASDITHWMLLPEKPKLDQ